MKLVITGYPDSGKTTLSHILECQFPHDVKVIPDPTDILNLQLFPVCKNKNAEKSRQKAFYFLQKEIEDLCAYNNKKKLFICDRGSLDYLANWPDTPKSFFEEVHSSLKAELKRYDWVIALKNDQPEADANTFTLRDPQTFWQQHPNYIPVSSRSEYTICATRVAEIVKKVIAGKSRQEILNGLRTSQKNELKEYWEITPKHHDTRILL